MSEALSGKGGVERDSHWCPTYQGLQRQLSTLEREGGGTIHVNYSPEHAPEVWEGRTDYPDQELIPSPEVQEAKSVLRDHRTSCDPCIAHFSPQSE